jgi:uncharacterized membrane protein YcaP (DUF421 family)
MLGTAKVDWAKLLVPDTPLIEIFLRGSLVYLALFLLLRLFLKRQSAAVGITDMLVVVLIADAAQNAMAGAYTSIPDGVLLVATILFWSYALDWLGFRFPRFLRPPPLPLVKDGLMLRHNMRQELVTVDELMSMLRQQGVEHLSQVKAACMEGDGHISIVPADPEGHGQPRRRVL